VNCAKTCHTQGKGQALKDHDPVYGGNFIESLASYDPDTSSWRTFQHSLLGGLTLFSGAWPRSGTMQAGTVYRRQPLAPLTGGTECSLWPTPRATEIPNSQAHIEERTADGRKGPSSLTSMVDLVERKMWPTPTKSDYRSPNLNPGMGKDGKTPPASEHALQAVVARLEKIPTPDANCWKGGNRRGQITDPSCGVTPNGGQLNPQFVSWLMGFPMDWCDMPEESQAESLTESPNLKDSETP